jgi:hypothetical protein
VSVMVQVVLYAVVSVTQSLLSFCSLSGTTACRCRWHRCQGVIVACASQQVWHNALACMLKG